MRLLAAACTVVVLASCTGSRSPALATLEPTPQGLVSEADYGDDWPFLVPEGELVCDPSGRNDGRLLVRFRVDGIEYALNGQAVDFGFPELDETILKEGAIPADLNPLIERGLELCQ